MVISFVLEVSSGGGPISGGATAATNGFGTATAISSTTGEFMPVGAGLGLAPHYNAMVRDSIIRGLICLFICLELWLHLCTVVVIFYI